MVVLSEQSVVTPDDTEISLSPQKVGSGRRRWLAAKKFGLDTLLGSIIVLSFAICAIFAPILAPFDPNRQHVDGLTELGEPLAPGQSRYLLGTDTLGRDVLSRLIYGARVAMFIATVPNVLSLILATAIGATAGFYGSAIEMALMRITETMMVLPTFLLALALISVLGTSTSVVVLVLVLISWTYPARVIYGETIRIREFAFVEAARSLGATNGRILLRHIIPQLRSILIIYFSLNAAWMVLLEAGLGFLGFGVQPPTPSWGLMIASGRDVLFWPWLMLLPGVCLALLGTGFYLLGTSFQRRSGGRLTRVYL